MSDNLDPLSSVPQAPAAGALSGIRVLDLLAELDAVAAEPVVRPL